VHTVNAEQSPAAGESPRAPKAEGWDQILRLWPLPVLAIALGALAYSTWGTWGATNVDAGTAVYRATLLSEGGVLYRDIHSPYGPLADYAMAGLFALFGPSLTVVYFAGLSLIICQSIIMWKIGRQLVSSIEMVATLGLFWALFCFDSGLFNWLLPNTFSSPFAILFSTAAVLCMTRHAAAPSNRFLVLASLATALAGTTKIEFGAAAYGTIVLTLLLSRPSERPLVKDLVLATIPGATAALLMFAATIARGTNLEEMIFDNMYRVRSFGSVARYRDSVLLPILPLLQGAVMHYAIELPLRAIVIDTAIRRARSLSWTSVFAIAIGAIALLAPFITGYPLNTDFARPFLLQSQFAWVTVIWAVVLLASAIQIRQRPGRPESGVLFVVAVYSLLITLRWNLHVAWAPFYAVFAPLLVTLCIRWTARAVVGYAPTSGVAAVVAIAALCGALHNQNFIARKNVTLEYPRGVVAGHPRFAAPMKRVINHIRNHTRPEDYVAVVPEEHFINFFAERRHPSRDPGIGPGWLANAEDVRDYFDELEKHDTELIVVSKRRYPGMAPGEVTQYLPQLKKYIDQRYTEELGTRFFKVYRRKDRYRQRKRRG
jgi:hypothetical protein